MKQYEHLNPVPALNLPDLAEKDAVYLDEDHTHTLVYCEPAQRKTQCCPFCESLYCYNATTEGVNSLIGHLNDMGRGYKFEVLRIKTLFHRKSAEKPSYAVRKIEIVDAFRMGFGGGSQKISHYEDEQYLASGGGTNIAEFNEYMESGKLLF